uniref:Olfactory receptor family 51 subfamily M member 1 n=1 Tax=Chinchilla lanigera TaxID=34839 RepID=A0A8C2W696_CHILA
IILSNITHFNPVLSFTGFPGLEAIQHWILIPFFFMYLVASSGNCFILIIINTNPQARGFSSVAQPTYKLLSLGVLTVLGLSVSIVPTTMGIILFNSRSIYFEVCQIQMFCIHSLSFMESAVLLVMPFDCFVAICHPLRYSVIIISQPVIMVGLCVILRGPVAFFPPVLLLKAFLYCDPLVLLHSFCLQQEVIHLACIDTTFSNLYALTLGVFTAMMDMLLTALPYTSILHTVAELGSRKEQLSAFQTCTSHLCAVLIFFVSMLGLSLVHHF